MNLIDKYRLEESDLIRLNEVITDHLRTLGVQVHFTNLAGIVETDIYHIDRSVRDEDKHHETCVSDGMSIWQHFELDPIGGICGRLYDITFVDTKLGAEVFTLSAPFPADGPSAVKAFLEEFRRR